MKEKKQAIKFFALLLVCMLLGMVTGRMGSHFQPLVEKINLTEFYNVFVFAETGLFALVNLILGVISFMLYNKCRQDYDRRAEEDETIYDQLEYRLDMPLLLSNTAMILNLVFFAATIYFFEKATMENVNRSLLFTVDILIMIAGYVWILALQNKIVNFSKKMNPEKRGSIFDIRFQKTWVESCDEAQKLMIYQSAYKAFNVTNIACSVCWVIAFLSMLFFETGIFPVIMIGVIYLTLIMSYTLTARKLEKPLDREE